MANYVTSAGLRNTLTKLKGVMDGELLKKVDVVEGKSLLADTEITKLSKITLDEAGVISVDNLPDTAFERCVTVASDVERFALTKDQVQNGDTVRVEVEGSTPIMYMVVDEEKLNEEAGYKVYASITDWSTVRNIPTKVATPTTLDIKVNGTSIATYNGFEESTVEANILPDDIGLAETSNEEIDAMFVEIFGTTPETTEDESV